MRSFRAFIASVLLIQPVLAFAVPIFPDVPDSDPFQADIEALVRAGVVHGNPDGTFAPDRTINRAELLKLLYLATAKTPSSSAVGCFPDVVKGSWYETYVCDATQKKFVQGYPDGTFRPSAPVARVEALKMIFEVFGLPAPAVTSATTDVMKYTDISVSAWYARYLYAAFNENILPVYGMDGATFAPDRALLRKEAAAFIAGALEANTDAQSSSSSSSVSSTVSSRSSSSSVSSKQPVTKNVSFPFSGSGQFEDKDQVSYLFTLTQKTTMRIDAKITGAITSNISCRVYLIEEDGFSGEYYMGLQEGSSCILNVTLRPGDYQLQLEPTGSDAYYTVDVTASQSDSNDGFIDAVRLTKDVVRSGLLDANDSYDWYTFVITKKMQAYIEVSPAMLVGCTIYMPLDVDQFGFEGPKCNAYYEFEPGTYTVGISHGLPLVEKQTYTIKLR